MKNLVSQSEFARRIGVSHTMIYKIKDRLTLINDGKSKKPKIDLNGSKTLKYLAEQAKKEEENFDPSQEPKQQIIQPSKPTLGNNPSGLPSDPDDITKLELDKLKIKEQTEQLKIKNAMIRGDLIEKKHVVKLFAKIHEIDQNQFKTLNIKVVPKISSVYNVANDNNTKAILKIIGRETDKELKTEIVSMLNAGEEERILENTKILEDATGEILAAVMRETDNFIRNMEE
jgi:hypothetical protein